MTRFELQGSQDETSQMTLSNNSQMGKSQRHHLQDLRLLLCHHRVTHQMPFEHARLW